MKISVKETPWKSTSSGREYDSIWKTKTNNAKCLIIVWEQSVHLHRQSCKRHDCWSILFQSFEQAIFPMMRRNLIVNFCMQSPTSAHFKEVWNNDFDRSVGILPFYHDQAMFSLLLAFLLNLCYFTSLQLSRVDRAPLPVLHKGLERVAQLWGNKSWPLLPNFLGFYSLTYFDLIEK